jgi:hypothetical protein
MTTKNWGAVRPVKRAKGCSCKKRGQQKLSVQKERSQAPQWIHVQWELCLKIDFNRVAVCLVIN